MVRVVPVDTDVEISWDEVMRALKPIVKERLPQLRGLPLAVHLTPTPYGVTLNVRVLGPVPKP